MDPHVTTQEPGGRQGMDHELRKEQKLEMMGALAGFIAHDLNNELTVILGNVGLALDSVDEDHPLYEGLIEAQRACHRCVDMTHALLSLGQDVKPEIKPVELDQLLKATERILRKVLPTTVPTKFAKYTHLPTIMADATQIQQVHYESGIQRQPRHGGRKPAGSTGQERAEVRNDFHIGVERGAAGGKQQAAVCAVVGVEGKPRREYVWAGAGHRNRARARGID